MIRAMTKRKEPLPERTCAFPPCGVAFTPRRADSRFHSDDCRHAYWKAVYQTEPHACPFCKAQHDPEERAVLDALEALVGEEGYRIGNSTPVLDAGAIRAFIARRRAILNASVEVEVTGHLF